MDDLRFEMMTVEIATGLCGTPDLKAPLGF